MAIGGVFTKNGKNTALDRLYNASPTYNALTQFGIGSGSTTPSEADTGLETAITAWSGGSDYKNFDSTPVPDTANKTMTWRGIVLATQANGNTIREIITRGLDGRIGERYVINAVSKTSGLQLNFTGVLEAI